MALFFSNQILPYFATHIIRVPSFPGIFCAVLFSGGLRYETIRNTY